MTNISSYAKDNKSLHSKKIIPNVKMEKNIIINSQNKNPYETDEMLNMYLNFHYGKSFFDVPNYLKALTDIAIRHSSKFKKALDIGCSVGRASFELSQYFEHTDALDYSNQFIQTAKKIQSNEAVYYTNLIEGEISEYKNVNIKSFISDTTKIKNILFNKSDACYLEQSFSNYDLILAANLLDRLKEPALFLKGISQRMNSDGVFILSSPYTWMEKYTDKKNWLGGITPQGSIITSYDALKNILSKEFTEVQPPSDIPYIIQETSREYQLGIAELTVWRKK
ncbi:putative 4-mercaptohistidine N1-methyltransferase [Silvanigrella aquatica]|uniref:Putative 4-mercaptohistidine N1-methyltransferase n=1 Tax=Silvanigrella aquatica TaxID=1915309 RepID=A0A1L4D3R2_9BACT|nr:putative 4-mercaptohistidine N1-methyltransferase [Silvanigrella aquatica]APJ04820.1 putative 4-mercaptohistidine N1-methyltransferase [Silvanigrella aquatica]